MKGWQKRELSGSLLSMIFDLCILHFKFQKKLVLPFIFLFLKKKFRVPVDYVTFDSIIIDLNSASTFFI